MAVEKGKDCIEIISRALECIQQRKPKAALKLLATVKKDGRRLEEFVQATLEKIEPAEQHYIKKERVLLEEIGELGQREAEKREALRVTEVRSDLQIAELEKQQKENERKVEEAENDLQSAQERLTDSEHRLEIARTKRDRNKSVGGKIGRYGGAFYGALMGVMFGPLGMIAGALVGCAAGAAMGEAIGRAVSDVDKAKADLDRATRHRSRCRSKLFDSKNQVEKCIQTCDREKSSLRDKISTLNREINRLKQERERCHGEVGRIKELIVFLKEASMFWGEFGIAVNSGIDRTDLLQKLIDRAKGKDRSFSRRFFRARGTQTAVSTFIEAWDNVEKIVCEGNLPYLYCTDEDNYLADHTTTDGIRETLELRRVNATNTGAKWSKRYCSLLCITTCGVLSLLLICYYVKRKK